jgi:hypothetical protein
MEGKNGQIREYAGKSVCCNLVQAFDDHIYVL